MAKPQVEDGYTRIANELLDAMCLLHLSGNQWKVLHAVIRKTYGWNKKQDWITATQIAKMTGLYRSHVSSALAVLVIRKIILREGRLIAVQKDYDLWQTRLHNVTNTCNKPKLPIPVTDVTNTCTQSVPIPVHTKDKRHSTKDKGRRKKKSPKSEAILTFRHIMKRNPRKAQEPMIDEVVADIALWERCLKAWVRKGYNPMNIDGPLDWYSKGGPPKRPGEPKIKDVTWINT